MRATPYALSVHHFISTVGSDAGFAAIIGLAIVVLLFFAHARETANLRHRATEAEAALHRLEQYLDQLARSGNLHTSEPVPAPAPASAVSAPGAGRAPAAVPARAGTGAPVTGRAVAPAPAPTPVSAMAGAPGAPAGVGAPALSAATRLIPAADDGAIAIRSNLPAAAARPRAGATAAVMDPPGPPPSTTAGGANGNRIPPVPPPASAGQTMGGRERLPLRPVAARPAAASEQRRRQGQRPGGSRIGRGAIVLAVALVVVVAVGAFLVLSNSGQSSAGNTTTPRQAARTTSATSTHGHRGRASAAGGITPATVTVAVLNGTSTTNLAHDISQRLQAAGFKPGNIATATDQTQSSTTVGYLPNDKRDAQAVAKSLKLAPGSVQAVDPNNRTVACSGSTTSCPAQVVVTVGTDLAAHA